MSGVLRRRDSRVRRVEGASPERAHPGRRVEAASPERAHRVRRVEGYSNGHSRGMRSHVRTVIVLALAAGLVALFLHNVDLWGVASNIARARPEWLALSLATMLVNLALRSLRWRYLLEPLGHTTFA